MSVRIGYFADFKQSDTLLFDADALGLRALIETFRLLASGSAGRVAVNKLPFVEVHHGVVIIALLNDSDRGSRRSDGKNAFLWERDATGWEDAAEKLEVLVDSNAGHHYLDGLHDEVVVEVSKGEYSDEWWATHG